MSKCERCGKQVSRFRGSLISSLLGGYIVNDNIVCAKCYEKIKEEKETEVKKNQEDKKNNNEKDKPKEKRENIESLQNTLINQNNYYRSIILVLVVVILYLLFFYYPNKIENLEYCSERCLNGIESCSADYYFDLNRNSYLSESDFNTCLSELEDCFSDCKEENE